MQLAVVCACDRQHHSVLRALPGEMPSRVGTRGTVDEAHFAETYVCRNNGRWGGRVLNPKSSELHCHFFRSIFVVLYLYSQVVGMFIGAYE